LNIAVTIQGLPRMANGGHGSWQRGARERREWKVRVARELIGLAPAVPLDRLYVRFTRCSSVEPDYDGLVHGFKPVRDALVRYGFVVDDRNQNVVAEYLWKRTPLRKGHIRVEMSSEPMLFRERIERPEGG
jgi:hypothetical protein